MTRTIGRARTLTLLALTAGLVAFGTRSFGGGAISVNGQGVPMTWPTASPVIYNPDQGGLGTLNNTQAELLLADAFSRWQNVPNTAITFAAGVPLPQDVNAVGIPATNPAHWANFWRVDGDGLSPVIFDADGSIIDDMFGAKARLDVLGAAGIDNDITVAGTITGASIVINGAFFDGIGPPSSPIDEPSQLAFESIMVHEVGHFINLDHSVVNHEAAGDGDLANDAFIPTMYPFKVDDEESIASLNPDDEAAVASLYPSPSFAAATAGFKGTIFATPQSIGPPALTVSPGGLGFGIEPVGVQSPGRVASLTNLTATATGVINFSLTGTNAQDFLVIGNTCGALAAGARCSMTVAFQPTASGPRSASLVLNAMPGGGVSVPLSGGAGAVPVGLPFQGAEVVARRTDNPQLYAYSGISGARFFPCNVGGPCDGSHPPEEGRYSITGITPGTYRICIRQIDTTISQANGTFVGPLATPATIPGPEECYDAQESPDPASDNPEFVTEVTATTGTVAGPFDIQIDDLPAADPQEPNNTLAAAWPLAVGPASGRVTIPAVLDPGDLDYFQISVAAGDVVQIDVEAAEIGSTLDAVVGLYDGSDHLLAISDDDIDPESQSLTLDPALTYRATYNGTAKIVVASYPNTAFLPGSGTTSGPYWLKVVVDADADADGIVDRMDACPDDPGNDADRDGVCAGDDNCPSAYNPSQTDSDGDGVGDDCDDCRSVSNPGQLDNDEDGIGDACDACPGDRLNDIDGDGICGDQDNCPTLSNPLQDGGARIGISPGPTGQVFTITPDSLYAIFVSVGSGGQLTVQGNSVGGGSPVTLVGPLPSGANVFDIRVSPDSSRAVIELSPGSSQPTILESVNLSTLGVTLLAGGFPANHSGVTRFQISPDSSRVVYWADPNPNGIFQMYSVPIGGGGATALTALSFNPGDPANMSQRFAISPDSLRVVYQAEGNTLGVGELYSVPITGGISTKLNGPLVANGDVKSLTISPNGLSVLYSADQFTDEVVELFRVPIAGGLVTKLNGAYVSGGNLVDFTISPDSARVVYTARQDSATFPEVYSVPTLGGTITKLNAPLLGGAGFGGISPDGSRVVYVANQDSATVHEVYSVPIAGGTAVKVSAPLPSDGDNVFGAIGPDGARVLYFAKQHTGDPYELYSAPITGSSSVKLNATLPPGDSVSGPLAFALTSTVVYLVTDSVFFNHFAFSVGIAGGTSTQLTTPESLSNPQQYRVTPDGRRIVWQTAGATALFSADLVGDSDLDGVQNFCDDCPLVSDASQLDSDEDGVGDACDNCLSVPNPTQSDTEPARGADGICGTLDDNTADYGPDGVCGTGDDLKGDGIGDACPYWKTAPGVFAVAGSHAVAWGDYDRDADPDLYVTETVASTSRLLQNRGGGLFVDATAPPLTDTGTDLGASWGDYDNDGDLDLYVTRRGPGLGNRLLRNDGGGVFTDVTTPTLKGTGISSAGVWIDYDRDGDLDLYLVKLSGGANQLLRNDGGGTFTDATPGPLALTASGQAAAWGDFDDDGLPDLYVANGSTPNALFRNLGGGSFTPVVISPDVHGLDAAWGDYDNDGDLDLLAIGVNGPTVLYRNDGEGRFAPLIATIDGQPISATWGDYDNDGNLDILMSITGAGGNVLHLFKNDGGGDFADADTPPLGSPGTGGQGVAFADYDGDGHLDFAAAGSGVSKVVRNTIVNGNHWLELDLRGATSNRSAIGARVRVTTGGVTRVREVTGGTGYRQDGLTVHVGLGPAALLSTVEIGWPSGFTQKLSGVAADQRLSILEAVNTSPVVKGVYPPNNSVDAALSTSVVLTMSVAIDPTTAVGDAVSVSRGGLKVNGFLGVSSDGTQITFDPLGPLQTNTTYVVRLSSAVKDPLGNAAVPFTSSFDTTGDAASGTLQVDQVGTEESGSTVGGTAANDNSGFAVAALGDVNGDGIADLLVGAPNADNARIPDVGRASLVFGQVGLQSNGGTPPAIQYLGEGASQHAGSAVSRAGDINGDGRADFLIGAPNASPHGTSSGKVYLVFGNSGLDELAPTTFNLSNLAACSTPTLCGIVFNGAAAGDLAGASLAAAGDVNNDGKADLLIAAPGASPGSRTGAGKVYLIFGPLNNPGTIELSSIGVTQPGLVFNGESAGDAAGQSVSGWPHGNDDPFDDLIIGAPGADVTDDFGTVIPDAGYVYAIHGGSANLVPIPASPATIELSRVADGLADQVQGVVFLGAEPGGQIGRSVTGEVDLDGDGVPDVVYGANNECWIIPGNDPKTESGGSSSTPKTKLNPGGLGRIPGGPGDAIRDFHAAVLTPGTDGDLGGLSVGPAGDVNNDGLPDLVVGAASADPSGKVDAGKAYLVYGAPVLPSGERHLSDVGHTIAGLTLEGFAAGDQLGSSVGGGFDVNGDGIADALVGAPFANSLPTTPLRAGETYILSPVASGEVAHLDVRHAGPTAAFLEWSTAIRAFAYNVYRGRTSTLRLSGGVRTVDTVQLACGINTDSNANRLPDLTDPAIPSTGTAFFYLVTGTNLAGEGPLGPPGAVPPEINDSQCP